MTASFSFFARHELKLAWRDFVSMMTAGRRAREPMLAVGVAVFVVILHGVALLVLSQSNLRGLKPDLPTCIAITAALLLSGSAMLSQAMESVTRAFYARSDLELILASPARVERLFAVRIGAMALSVCAMALLFAGPFIDVLAWRGSLHLLCAYGVIAAVALVATALAVLLTLALFRTIGARRTRLMAQIVAAVIGAGFVIGLQVAAMFSTGTLSRFAVLRSPFVLAHAPLLDSFAWWPARAALGDGFCLVGVLLASTALFLAATLWAAPRFADCVLAAGSVARQTGSRSISRPAFNAGSAAQVLRRKEWLLLARDPWLVSQSLMQILYLLPPALLLWRSFSLGGHAALIVVPVLIMASGQLAGGLAWLTISGEDAPDLVLSAPVTARRILRAKIEAVMGAIALAFAPLTLAFACVSVGPALVAACGIALAAGSSVLIQLWFRSQAKRSQFRRRHTSSRIATFAEAFSSITWAGTGAIAAAGSPLAVIMAALALALLAGVHRLAPAPA